MTDDNGTIQRNPTAPCTQRRLARVRPVLSLGMAATLGLAQPTLATASGGPPWQGVNLVVDPKAPLGSPESARSLADIRALGATAVALVVFFWQPDPHDPRLVPGNGITASDLRAGIRQAHAAGLRVLLKPHVWVPGSWAGAVALRREDDWHLWFGRYGSALVDLAVLAREEGVEALAIGTELRGTSHRPEWQGLIARVRAAYPGLLTYVAHWDGELAQVPFWPALDVAAVSLYPPIAPGDEPPHRPSPGDAIDATAVGAEVDRALDRVRREAPAEQSLWIAELGFRSAEGTLARPWESAEERDADVDLRVQALGLALWQARLGASGLRDVFIWRWITDPAAGGPGDTDFTIQGKPAARAVACAFTGGCDPLAVAAEPDPQRPGAVSRPPDHHTRP